MYTVIPTTLCILSEKETATKESSKEKKKTLSDVLCRCRVAPRWP
jgi:hypothetical protein